MVVHAVAIEGAVDVVVAVVVVAPRKLVGGKRTPRTPEDDDIIINIIIISYSINPPLSLRRRQRGSDQSRVYYPIVSRSIKQAL